jgi:hypothetical protein
MQFRISFRVCGAAVAACLFAACSKPTTSSLPKQSEPDYVEIVVANKGPSNVNDLRVRIAGQDFGLGGFGPGVYAACRFSPRTEQVGQTATVVLQYEDDNGARVCLESKGFKIPPRGTVRLDVGGSKLVAQEVADKPSGLTTR